MNQSFLFKDIILPHETRFDGQTFTPFYGKFSIYPFDKGVGVTIANSLRRILLSAIPGYAITAIKIEGVNHEFEPVKGVKEDLIDVILAIKKIHLRLLDGSEKKVIHVQKKGPGELTAKDFAVDATIEVVNPDLKIATLNEDAELYMDVTIEYGRGYRSAEDLLAKETVISQIPVDALFSPVTRVNYMIEDYRVGERTDCEKVVLEVWTKGTLDPREAVSMAAAILRKYFSLLTTFEEDLSELGGGVDRQSEILEKPIEDLHLSARAYNCLKSVGISTIGELVNYDPVSLSKIKNFGKKSLTEISDKLAMYNLSLKSGPVEEDIEDIEENEDEE
ncbi:DNA-directed RNA polymerase subunit alpha [Thermospira aquatica]|uniref:DNA-directed RNA polymerase subunit alpha n=1 Tax=Thermospira aquatica TaxID=2828656 RepID=A0AAX3BAH8_9SPIR|nr:DNA-directed RNA polymerase subunit alpha [Thermospira aquatica]URA09063.1 DNA-directed RNA polymerase subunit alpha [Thermospira aquatica]